MTAIVGIMAYADPKNKKIVLASDTQLEEIGEEEDKPVSKTTDFRKIAQGSYWAIGFAGNYYQKYMRKFFRSLRENELLIEKAIKDKFSLEVMRLNQAICNEHGEKGLPHFLLAAAKPEIGLYFIDMVGNVKKRPVDADETADYIALGSGGTFVSSFLEEKMESRAVDDDNGDSIDIGLAIRLAYEAIDKNKDPSTGGSVELFTVGEDGVQNYGERLKKAMRKAQQEELENIIKESGSS